MSNPAATHSQVLQVEASEVEEENWGGDASSANGSPGEWGEHTDTRAYKSSHQS